MKIQYLGDSKDSFEWDYHHFLIEKLGYKQFKIDWMMTPDDHGPHGKTLPEKFPANKEIVNFCNFLRMKRNPELLTHLPARMGADYVVKFHDRNIGLRCGDGSTTSRVIDTECFSGIEADPDQVFFFDPDVGFEPERSCTEKHLRYSDIDKLIGIISPGSVVSVFQTYRRIKFSDDFARIRQRLGSVHSTAIHWDSVMFVCISSSKKTIDRVQFFNLAYAKFRGLTVMP